MTRSILFSVAALGLLLACSGEADKKPGARPAPVAVAALERGDFLVSAVFTGDIVAEAADVAAETQGRLQSVPARIGDHVKAGDILATIDSKQLRLQLTAAEARAAAAAAERKPALAELERSMPLVEQGLISPQALDELRAKVSAIAAAAEAAEAEAALLQRRVDDATVRSPIDGIVSTREQSVGSWVSVGMPLFRIVSSRDIYARLRIPESQIALVQAGAPAQLEIAGFEQPLNGVVRGVSGEIRANDRSAWAEVAISDPRGLGHGMFVRADIELSHLYDVAIVPAGAVIERLRDNVIVKGIFTANNDRATWVTAETLASDRTRTALDVELPAGTPVLIRGHLALSDGAAIRIASGVTTAATAP